MKNIFYLLSFLVLSLFGQTQSAYNPIADSPLLLLQSNKGIITPEADSVGTWEDQSGNGNDFTFADNSRAAYDAVNKKVVLTGVASQGVNADDTWLDITATDLYTMQITFNVSNTGGLLYFFQKRQVSTRDQSFYMNSDKYPHVNRDNLEHADPAILMAMINTNEQDGNTITVAWQIKSRGGGAENPSTSTEIYVNGIAQGVNLTNNQSTAVTIDDQIEIPRLPAVIAWDAYCFKYTKGLVTAAEILLHHNWVIGGMLDYVPGAILEHPKSPEFPNFKN